MGVKEADQRDRRGSGKQTPKRERETLVHGVEDIKHRLDVLTEANDGLRKFLDRCWCSIYSLFTMILITAR